MRNMIGEAGGSAEVLRAETIGGEPDLIATFNAVREREYGEIIAQCGEIIAQTGVLTAAAHFRYHDLGRDAELKTAVGMHRNDPRARHPRRDQRRSSPILPGQMPCGDRLLRRARLPDGQRLRHRSRLHAMVLRSIIVKDDGGGPAPAGIREPCPAGCCQHGTNERCPPDLPKCTGIEANGPLVRLPRQLLCTY
jgi:hypothetical protein